METNDIFTLVSPDGSSSSLKRWFFIFSFTLLLGGGIAWEYFSFFGNKPSEISSRLIKNFSEEVSKLLGSNHNKTSTPIHPDPSESNASREGDLGGKSEDVTTTESNIKSSESAEWFAKIENILNEQNSQIVEIQKKIEKLSKNSKRESSELNQEILALKSRFIEQLREGITEIRQIQISGKLSKSQITEINKSLEKNISNRLTKLEEMIKKLIPKDSDKNTPLPVQQEEEILEILTMPVCLLSSPPEIQNMLPLSPVDVQAKTIPDHLRPWMEVTDTQITEPPFFIMRREVTVKEFKQYYNELSPDQQEKFGSEWQRDTDENNPVASIPWESADGYAKWLSEKTGCFLSLPTRNQWRAAVMQYADPKKISFRKTIREGKSLQQRDRLPSTVMDLLHNLSEWSIEECQLKQETSYYWLLGDDYLTLQGEILRKPHCRPYFKLKTVGFRLVLITEKNGKYQYHAFNN